MKTIKNNIKTICLLIAVLGLQVFPAKAGVNEYSKNTGDAVIELATGLAPATPIVADFSDNAPEAEINIGLLAPITPSEAEFEDTESTFAEVTLAPIPPATATFEDAD